MKKSILSKRRRLNLSTLFLISLFLLAFRGVSSAQTGSIDLNALIQETQKTSRKVEELSLLWWIPEEFWRANLSQSSDVTPAQAEEFLKILRPYFILTVVDGKVGPMGGLSFRPEMEIRKSIQLVDASGERHSPLENDSFSADIRNLLQMIKPVVSNALGPLGQNMHFLVFPAKNSKGVTIADARREGGFSIKLGNNEYKWRLPLGSLLAPKTCPVDGEQLNGAWAFCPWHGAKLVRVPGNEPKN